MLNNSLGILSWISAKAEARREARSKDRKITGSQRSCSSKTDHEDASDAKDDAEDWRLVDLDQDGTQKHRGKVDTGTTRNKTRETKPTPRNVSDSTNAEHAVNKPTAPVSPAHRLPDVGAMFHRSADSAIYRGHGDQAGCKTARKPYHYKAKDWRHFNDTLHKEYAHQLQEPLYRAPTVNLNQEDIDAHLRRSDSKCSPTVDSYTTGEQKKLTDLFTERASSAVTIDPEKQQTIDNVNGFVNSLLHRVQTEADLKSTAVEAEDRKSVSSNIELGNKRWTPRQVAGRAQSGICRDTKRSVAWAVDVAPPKSGWNTLDPQISEAFHREYGKILAQRERDTRQKAELATLSCRPVNSPVRGLISHGCRIPVPVKGTLPTPRETRTSGSRFPVLDKPNVEPTSQLKSKREKQMDHIVDHEVEMFKGTQLYRERVRLNKAWQTGLTPLQIWVIKKHTTDTEEEKPQPQPQPKKKIRAADIKCKVSCWRK